MTYYCGKCKTTSDSEEMTIVTCDHGASFETNIHCPNCQALLVTFGEEDSIRAMLDQAEADFQREFGPAEEKHTCRVEQYLPNADQCRYSLHLYAKQREKLTKASEQLEDMITKTEVLLELAKEREAVNG